MSYSPKAFEITTLGTSQIGKFISTHGTTGDVIIPDDDKFSFGTGSDASIYFDATNLVIADENIPVQIGNSSSTVTIAGNLTINGTTTTVNSTTLTIDDKLIELAHSPSGSEGADTDIDGGGIILKSSDSDKSITWVNSTDSWTFDQGIDVSDLNIINVGDIDCDSISIADAAVGLNIAFGGNTGTNKITLTDNLADALNITEGSNSYMKFITADSGFPTVTFGVDDTGVDVRLYSATASEGVLYDASEDELALLLTTKLKFHDVGGDEEIFASANGHLEINAGTTLDITAPTVDINASTGVTIDTDTVTVASANSTDPVMILKNTNTDANGARLRFVKDAGEAGAASDISGLIEFYADDASQDQVLFAKVEAAVAVHTNGQEGGKLTLGVASHDGEMNSGLILTDGSAEDEIDVTVGNGTASVTTVAGNLTVTGDVTISGDDLTMGTNTDKFILVADGTNFNSVLSTGDVIISNDGSSAIQANVVDGTHIALGSDEQGDIMYYDGTNWARLVHGTNGQFLKTQGDSANPVWAAATVSSLACDDLSVGDAAVTVSTSVGNITIETQATDTDIIFNVDDGGSQITALTLDGSDDGAAIFKSTIKGTVFKPAVEVVSSANVTVSKGHTAITTAGSNRTATMPEATAALVGATYTIKKVDSGSGNISVTAEGDGLIDGGATVVLYHQFESVTVVCRAADVWDIV